MELTSPKAVACIVVLITVAFVLGLAHSPLAGDEPTDAPSTTAPAASSTASSRRSPTAGNARVFFARLQSGDGVTEHEARLVADAILVAAKPRAGYSAVGITDLQGIIELDAAQQAADCDVVSCASELADALDAPQLVTGQLGRVGATWILTLTRVDRATLSVLAREQFQGAGAGADAVLPAIPALVERLLPEPSTPTSPLLASAVVAGSAAAVLGGVGGTMVYLSHGIYAAGIDANARGDRDTATTKRAEGEPLYYFGWSLVVGGAALLVGAAVAGGFGIAEDAT